MPNWCNNTLSLTGPKEKISAIYAKAKKDNALLQQLKPMPEALEGTTSPTGSADKPQPMVDGFDNWYDWRVQNWGTKWDVDVDDNLELSDDGTTISGWFDSAWAPPIHAYEYFLTENEDCSIKSYYYEGGMDFAGLWEDFADAEVTPSEFTADEMEDPQMGVIYDLNENFNFSEAVREYEEESDTEKFIVKKEAVNAE